VSISELCIDDIYEDLDAYASEGVSMLEAIERITYNSGISSDEHDNRIRDLRAALSTTQHLDLGHLLSL